MKYGISLTVSLIAILHAQSAAQAAQSGSFSSEGIELRAEKAVHKAKSPGVVKFTLINNSPYTVSINVTAAFWVRNHKLEVVHKPSSSNEMNAPIALPPGTSYSWNWNKKSSKNNKWAPPGTYEILVGPIIVSDWNVYINRNIDIALTPTGTIAGSSMFPLSVGNEWTYLPNWGGGLPGIWVSEAVTEKNGVWYRVHGLLNTDYWARMVPSVNKTKKLMVGDEPSSATTLFDFGADWLSMYSINDMWIYGVKLMSKNETVETPAGTFKNCYRFSLQYLPNGLHGQGFKSFWFAPGVGLVKYTTIGNGHRTFSLYHAKIRASNGVVYNIGRK